jgi:thiopeptide-type bacteriocin biosynthesis protein
MAPSLSPADFFVMRTPALSWSVIEEWSRGLSATRTLAAGGDVDSALRTDIALLRDRLRSIVKRSAVQRALYIASPDLFARIGPWIDGDDTDEACRVEPAIVRYVMRMAGRATPFGLFASTSVGTIGRFLSLGVPASATHVRHLRLDTEYVFNLADRLAGCPALLHEVRFQATDTVYEIGGRWRYYEPRLSRHGRRFRLVDVEPSPHLQVALDAARRDGGATLGEIAAAICASFDDVASGDALGYAEELAAAKLLRDPWSPAPTGGDPAIDLIGQLSATAAGRPLAMELRASLAEIQDAETLPESGQLAHYQRIASRLSSHTQVDSARMLRIDQRHQGQDVAICPAILEEVRGHVERLARIMNPPASPAMRAFVREFERRYHGSEVPVLQALDEDVGIGFDVDGDVSAEMSSLLENIPFNRPQERTVEWNARTAWLFEKLGATLRRRGTELVLSDDEVDALSTQSDARLPPGLSVLVSIAATSADAADRGEYSFYLRKAFGPNSAKLLGRFCDGDAELRAHVERALRREEAGDADAIHAEVVHLPHNHAANTICRPMLRGYEIPLFDRSAAPRARQITLSDLLVSVDRGVVVLRSARHGRRVVPHLTCAHAFRKSSVGLYRFLASLEEQDAWSELAFSWGPLATAPFLPRVVQGRCVLALARWTIQGAEVRAIDALPPGLAFRALQELRGRLELPQFVLFADVDHALPVDFENALSLQSFVKVARHAQTVALTELFPGTGELIARGEEGAFHHELVIPFHRENGKVDEAPAPRRAIPAYHPGRKEFPGGSWFFVKAYCGVATVDRVLATVISPLVAALRSEQAIDRWFFVRHADPRWHFRLRLHGEPPHLWNGVAPRLLGSLARVAGLIQSVTVDTYDPEAERYGGSEALVIAEQIFMADSEAALAIIQQYRGDLEARWRLALYGMNALLDDFAFSLEQKQQIVRACRTSQLPHDGTSKPFRRRLSERYRALRQHVEQLLDAPTGPYSTGAEAINNRSRTIVPLAAALSGLETDGRLQSPLTVIAESHLHMWANRVFRSGANAQEFVLYDFLDRHYAGRIERERTGR